MRDDDARGGGEATLAHPDHVETVDVVGGRLRERARGDTGEELPTEPGQRVAGDVGARVGRYQLLELVGAGGMGMVWGAWDPELERRVALKLVRLTSHESRDRMLREGQVLARLSHPNVVPIFDVGMLGDQVFLVMEWVRGTTLRAYAAPGPGLRALLDAYRQAGAGLDAAHRAGVVHRDFKPDNAIRGDDGRVRVLDFGLAQTGEVAAGSRHAGTPRYMAPEQVRGEVTAAVDQFAFCVALREALERAGAVPAWIAAIIERGTRAAPAERFASMAALLAALERDPARARRRGAIAAAAAAVAIGAFAVGRARAPAAAAPCSAGRAELAWTPVVRERVAGHLRALAPIAAAELDGTARRLDDYADGWVAAHRATCEAGERGALTPPLHDARLGCLQRAHAQLAGVIELLDRAATVDEVSAAQHAAGALPAVRDCALAGPVVPPPPAVAADVKAISERVERGWVLATARRPEAVERARAVTAEADRTGYQPLLARALLVEGWAAVLADQPHGRDALDRAWQVALAAFDEPLAVEAYARWVYAGVRMDAPAREAATPAAVIARSLDGGAQAALEQWPMMRVIAERLGDEGRFARALLYNNVALPLVVADDKRGARALLELALQSAGDDPPIELVAILENLARLETDPAACERQLRAALARQDAALGPTHPIALTAMRNLAMVIRERRTARATFDTACRGLAEHQQAGALQRCAYEAAWVADEDGDRAAARAQMTSAAGLPDIRGRIAAAYVELADGAPRSSTLAELERYAAQDLPRWLDRLNAADALVALALAAERDAPTAERTWQRALAMLDTIDYVHFARRKARVRAVVAERIAAADPAHARALATQALAWYRGVPGDDALVARLEGIARSAGGSR